MASKANKFYFENFTAAADCACRAADYLVECLSNFKPGEITTMMQAIHQIEHEADGIKHEMSHALARAFVTPIDREDLAMISQNIDEVADKLEEVVQCFYIDQVQEVTADAIEFSKKLVSCCRLMKAMLAQFEDFKKKPKELHEMIVELNHSEEECDRLYLEASLRIRKEKADALEILSWRDIYDRMEECADACEHVGDCVETVIMKNT